MITAKQRRQVLGPIACIRCFIREIHGHRQPKRLTGPPPESGRHDADHGAGNAVEDERFAENVRVAVEQAAPQAAGEYDDGVGLPPAGMS